MLKRKALIIIIIIVLSLVFIYIALSLLFLDVDPLISFLGKVTDTYLSIQEGIANKYLRWAGLDMYVHDHLVMLDGSGYDTVRTGTLMRKWITLLLFASLIFIMGENSWTSWIYILSGLLILNIANIMRLVLLFRHLQIHGTYVGLFDYHDLYDYVIYGIVFILWVIWFEKYSHPLILRRRDAV